MISQPNLPTMKCWRCDDARPIPGLVADTTLVPRPGAGELFIAVRAAGVTAAELEWYPTTHAKDGGPRVHAIPMHEFSGVVSAAGPDAAHMIGQDVFGMNDWYADGAAAEYCCTAASMVIPKPSHLSHVEAASVPISALTAWQGLFDHAKLRPNERVLIHGAAGAVGIFAVQLALWRQAHVSATASVRDRDFLLELGVREVIDYRSERFEERLGNIDVVFDTVGGSTLERSWNVLAPTGRIVTISSASESTLDERSKRAFFIVEPNQGQLREVAQLLESGRLRTMVKAVIPFEQTDLAYRADPPARNGRGKLVIAVQNAR